MKIKTHNKLNTIFGYKNVEPVWLNITKRKRI